jgi:hypothetical protein
LERERLASETQAKYNQAARRFSELYGKWFDVGGFTEPSGNQGWAYVKRREQPQARGGDAKPVQGGTGISRPRSQFNSSKFPGLRFD